MKKLIIEILVLCILLAGCAAKEADVILPSEPPILSDEMVSENTTVTEPNLPPKEESEEKQNTKEMKPNKAADESECLADPTVAPLVITEQPKTDTTPKPSTSELPAPTENAVQPTEPSKPEQAEAIPNPTEAPVVEEKPINTVPEEKQVPTEAVMEPENTEPSVPETTEPPAEVIDTATLESYGRSYASSAYGYNGTAACTPGTGAGYFPAATKRITSMEEGYSIVRQAIDSQYNRDMAYGYLPYEEIDGVTVRCPINVKVSSTGEPNVYTITVYYGGMAQYQPQLNTPILEGQSFALRDWPFLFFPNERRIVHE